MLKKITDLSSSGFTKGLNTNSNILSLEKEHTPNCMDVVINNDLSVLKRYGTSTQNATVIAQSGGAGFSPDSSSSLLTQIKAYWKLDEPSGTRFDSISTHHLQDNNTVGQDNGIKRYSASFIAANSEYLLFDNTSTLATGDVDFSMAAWFYLTSTGERTIISKRDIGSPDLSTKLLLHLNGANASTSFPDSSPSAHTVTGGGNVQISTAQSKFGGASGLFSYAGSSNLSIAGSMNDFQFGSADFTVEGFFFPVLGIGTTSITFYQQMLDDASNQYVQLYFGLVGTNFYPGVFCVSNGLAFSGSGNIAINTASWTHIAFVSSGGVRGFYTNGTQNGLVTGTGSVPNGTFLARIGVNLSAQGAPGAQYYNGWMDEFRISNVARYTTDFTAPTRAFGTGSEYEYSLFVNTDNVVTFRVSSSGSAEDGTVRATSFGAVSTATWYNAVAWHDTGDVIGVSVNLSANSAAYTSGVRSGSAPFVIGAISNGASAFMDGRIDEASFWKKVLSATDRSNIYNLGTGNTYNLAFGNDPWASFDFGASNLRWLTLAAGTGIYASSNLGITWVSIATDRTATYQSFERSKASLIATSDAYDKPLQWAGSANTFTTILNASAPLAKYSVNFQGFLILLNTNTRKRAFYYEDENTQLTGDWGDAFDLPSSADDEITGAIVLRKNLYISTRYSLYRLTFVGGNPDWRYQKVKDFGYVPRTLQVVSIKDYGEIAVGMDYSRHIRLFDGADDKIISTNIENDNMMCDFAMEKISYALSGLTVSHTMVNNDDIYKLCVSIGANSTQTTHTLNFDGRLSAFYPFGNTPFNTMVMAESAGRRFPIAFDRSGYCHIMDSGNRDAGVTPINDIFDSPFLFEKSPSSISKSQKIDLYFSPESSGTIRVLDRVDFSNTFRNRDQFALTNDGTKVQIKKSIDIPQTANVYQYRITSSAGTANPWVLNRIDYFLTSLGIGDSE